MTTPKRKLSLALSSRKALVDDKVRNCVKDHLLLQPLNQPKVNPLPPLNQRKVSSSATPTSSTTANLEPVNIPPLHPLQRRNFSRPPPIEGECLVCYEGEQTPLTPCCGKPLCDNCSMQLMEGQHITCPHCRERLPNDVIISNQEASDALLADSDFQQQMRAV